MYIYVYKVEKKLFSEKREKENKFENLFGCEVKK